METSGDFIFTCTYKEKAMETINGSEAWDDLLGFNNGVGGQMNCQDGKCVYLKCRAVEKMFMLENIQEIQSSFLFSIFLLVFSSPADMKQLGLRALRPEA